VIEVWVENSAKELALRLNALPPASFEILSIYGMGDKHWAWIQPKNEKSKPSSKPRG
jgi:hypothetical protein